MATRRLAQFDVNIGRARELVGLGQSVSGITVGNVDASDIYRAALVQAVAALDSYVHGVLLDHGVEILMGRRPAGKSISVGLNFGAIRDLVAASDPIDLELRARTHIAERLSKETFQKADSIASGFAMVGVSKVWSVAFPGASGEAKTALGLIVDRRNQIVHSCDVDPLNPGNVTPLSDSDARQAIDTIKDTVYAFDKAII